MGCGDSTVDPDDRLSEMAPIIEEVAENVILSTYVDLHEKSMDLIAAVDALAQNPTEENLSAARQAWRAARRPWEQSEAFIFGPVDSEGIDPSIDLWPVNHVDLDGVLASSVSLTTSYIDGLEGTLKGFHTIEYLLFGVDGTKTAASITPRELEYLTAVTQSFEGATRRLKEAWEPSGGNFVANFSNAGESGSIYLTRKDALQELVAGMIGIADEVTNAKINDPFTQQNRTLEESQFSDNSVADFQDNIRSIRNIYLGEYDGVDGKGISDVVVALDSALDARTRQEIDAAISAIGAMTPSFGEAIVSNRSSVEAAQGAIQTLKATLESDVLPLILDL
jgi:uncharacterized iron-regulated protein